MAMEGGEREKGGGAVGDVNKMKLEKATTENLLSVRQ
jgi:hypothetical protein